MVVKFKQFWQLLNIEERYNVKDRIEQTDIDRSMEG